MDFPGFCISCWLEAKISYCVSHSSCVILLKWPTLILSRDKYVMFMSWFQTCVKRLTIPVLGQYCSKDVPGSRDPGNWGGDHMAQGRAHLSRTISWPWCSRTKFNQRWHQVSYPINSGHWAMQDTSCIKWTDDFVDCWMPFFQQFLLKRFLKSVLLLIFIFG